MMEPTGHIAATSSRGSALILTVVLTSLLAIVGVLFVMAARVDKMATTATTESRELACAVDTVLAEIEKDLAADVPGAPIEATLAGKGYVDPEDPNKKKEYQEYYDYPDELNPWLADLEPYGVVTTASNGTEKTDCYWRQISNVGGLLTGNTRNVFIDGVVGERDPVDPNGLADADGDGVPDAKWFQVPGVMTSKGKRFYAAVRIVDNGGMLNMNTGFRFDPNDPNQANVNGKSPLQVNAVALAKSPQALLEARANNGKDPVATADLTGYKRNVLWQYLDVKPLLDGSPSPYTPFDIADELELRYRFLLQHLQGSSAASRVEACGLFRDTNWTPLESGGAGLDAWFKRAADAADPNYAYRHVATTYNMDRILTPRPVGLDDGTKRTRMVNVNDKADKPDDTTLRALRAAIKAGLLDANPNANLQTIEETAAQVTANLLDYIDKDDEVTVIAGLSSAYLGFERPCIYISEVACRQVRDPATNTVHSSYAIELYRPYFEDKDPNSEQWKLIIDNPSSTTDIELPIQWTGSGSRRFHVLLAEDAQAPLSDAQYLKFEDAEEPTDTMTPFGYNRADYNGQPQMLDPSWFKFESNASISLRRSVAGVPNPQHMDFIRVPEGWMAVDGAARSIQRDISPHKCVRRLWSPAQPDRTPCLGNATGQYVDPQRPEIIQAHPANKPLTNIGELGRIFRRNAYGIQPEWLEKDVLVNLSDPNYAKLFNYLTVIDPAPDTGRTDETRIMGRININTAPAFVLAQLPWMSYLGGPGPGVSAQQASTPYSQALALDRGREIIRYRESTRGPYRSTGDLMQVSMLHAPISDKVDNGFRQIPPGPDLTPDTARDDFEERDLLFTRISDLVTVRSDVFTAYILVRIGGSGPQKRIIAILDRSRVTATGGKVRLLAYHPVPDPR